MTYRFRVRWRLEHGRRFDGLDNPLAVMIVPDMGEGELKRVRGETHFGGQDLALKSGPFGGPEEARAVGEKVLAGLLLASLRRGFGLSTQARIPLPHITDYGKKLFAAGRFDTVYADEYGLSIFQEIGRTGFVGSEWTAEVRGPIGGFVEAWSDAARDVVTWDQRILASYDFYASSRFENSTRARFLMLVMAVEALVGQFDRSIAEIEVIDSLLGVIDRADLPTDQVGALKNGVRALKRVSIRHACRAYLSRAVAGDIVSDPGASAHFIECHALRSQIVHGRATSSVAELIEHANRLEKTIRELLMARIEGRLV